MNSDHKAPGGLTLAQFAADRFANAVIAREIIALNGGLESLRIRHLHLGQFIELPNFERNEHFAIDAETLRVFESLQPGDRIELKHDVKVGFHNWDTVTTGTVVRAERRRHGLHYRRNHDDKAFSDIIVLEKDGGELTTVTLDEFSVLRKLAEGG